MMQPLSKNDGRVATCHLAWTRWTTHSWTRNEILGNWQV